MFDFEELGDDDDTGGPPGSSLRAVWWINLARRPDRRRRHEAALCSAGLKPVAERIEAVDGSVLDLDLVDPALITAAAVAEAKNPPPRVVGVHMTRGAIGLWLSFHGLLQRIMKESLSDTDCYLLVEDDAIYCHCFLAKLSQVFAELDNYDPYWEAVQVGYFADECEVNPIIHGTMSGARELQHVVKPVWACGTAGIVVRGARGARRIHEVLFPARRSQQLDTAFSYRYQKLRMYLSREPLVIAEKSEEVDTDIQIMAEAVRGWTAPSSRLPESVRLPRFHGCFEPCQCIRPLLQRLSKS